MNPIFYCSLVKDCDDSDWATMVLFLLVIIIGSCLIVGATALWEYFKKGNKNE